MKPGKSIGINLIFLICIGGICAFQSHSQDKLKILTRKWLLVDLHTPRVERNLEQLGVSPERRTILIKRLVEGSYIDFKADGTYEATILGSQPEILNWKLRNDSVLLVRKNAKMIEEYIELETLNRKEMVMILPDIDGEFSRLFFVPDPKQPVKPEDEN